MSAYPSGGLRATADVARLNALGERSVRAPRPFFRGPPIPAEAAVAGPFSNRLTTRCCGQGTWHHIILGRIHYCNYTNGIGQEPFKLGFRDLSRGVKKSLIHRGSGLPAGEARPERAPYRPIRSPGIRRPPNISRHCPAAPTYRVAIQRLMRSESRPIGSESGRRRVRMPIRTRHPVHQGRSLTKSSENFS